LRGNRNYKKDREYTAEHEGGYTKRGAHLAHMFNVPHKDEVLTRLTAFGAMDEGIRRRIVVVYGDCLINNAQ
jgi:hypothetical protein